MKEIGTAYLAKEQQSFFIQWLHLIENEVMTAEEVKLENYDVHNLHKFEEQICTQDLKKMKIILQCKKNFCSKMDSSI